MTRWKRVRARLGRVAAAVAEKVMVAVLTKVLLVMLGLLAAWFGIRLP